MQSAKTLKRTCESWRENAHNSFPQKSEDIQRRTIEAAHVDLIFIPLALAEASILHLASGSDRAGPGLVCDQTRAWRGFRLARGPGGPFGAPASGNPDLEACCVTSPRRRSVNFFMKDRWWLVWKFLGKVLSGQFLCNQQSATPYSNLFNRIFRISRPFKKTSPF